MMRSTGVLAMGAGDRQAPTEQVEPAQAGIGGFDPARYRMGIVAASVDQMATAHRLAVQAIKAVTGTVKTGWTLALVDLQPGPDGEERWGEARRRGQTDWLSVSSDDDFVGVQTYSRALIGPDGQLPVPDGAATMQTGWEVYPEALGHTVRLAAEHAGVPVLVTENGMATEDDAARIAYTRAALDGLARCVSEGLDVRGYIHWTLLDNFEWNAGYSKTFGLIAFDPVTFARSVKPSARWLGRVARANGIDD
jgi:beta-glucosidase